MRSIPARSSNESAAETADRLPASVLGVASRAETADRSRTSYNRSGPMMTRTSAVCTGPDARRLQRCALGVTDRSKPRRDHGAGSVLLFTVAPNATTTNAKDVQLHAVDVGHLLRRVIGGDQRAWDELVADSDTLVRVLDAFSKLGDRDKELSRLLCTVPPLDSSCAVLTVSASCRPSGSCSERPLRPAIRFLGRVAR